SASTSRKTGTTTKTSTASAPVTNASIKQKEPMAKPALTNGKVIEMFKSGVDEDNIIATIRQSANAQFDISPDGQIELAKNGVKGKILAAMRERARRAKSSDQSPHVPPCHSACTPVATASDPHGFPH